MFPYNSQLYCQILGNMTREYYGFLVGLEKKDAFVFFEKKPPEMFGSQKLCNS